jgi:polar amino acid transport system substrate-binding protein
MTGVFGRSRWGRRWLAAITCAAAAQASQAAETGVLRWAGDSEGGAPYVFRDPRNPSRIVGFEVDLMNAVAKKLGRRAQFVQNQWDGLVPGLKRADYDVAVNGIEITEDRSREVAFSTPYYQTFEQITVRAQGPLITSLAEARGKVAGTLKYSLAERILTEQGIEVRGYDSQTTIYEDLVNGRLDFVLLDHPVAVYYGEPNPKLRSVGGPIGELAYGIALRKEDTRLLSQINQALLELKREGILRDIYDRWGIWSPVMAEAFKDTSPSRPARELEAYLEAMGQKRGWKERATQYLSYLPLLAQGAVTTIELSFLGMLFAVAIGLVVALLRLYGGPVLAAAATVYVELIRGTPLLIQLFFIFYGLPNVGIKLSPFLAAVIGLALNYSAYEAEVYRSGLQSVPRGQMDAAFSLGMTRLQALWHVIIPQATRVVLPPMTNDFISLLKDSSLVSVITMVELTKVYGQLASTYYDYFGIGLLTAGAYFLIGLPFVRLSRWVEKKFSRGRATVV